MNQTDIHPEMLSPYDPRHTPLPPPDVDICAGPVHTICVNAAWWSHISGMIARLTYRDAWAGTDAEISDAIESITKILNVGRPTMGCGCGSSGLPTRYTADGTFQVSYDGGVTWVDAPDEDPRNNVTLLPPLTVGEGEDGKCKAANSGVAWFKQEQRDNYALLQANAGLAEIISILVAFIVALGIVATGGAIGVLVGAIAAFVYSVTATEFNEAFTTAVWDRFLCSLYCNMGDDLSFTEAQYQAVKSDMLTESNFIVRTWFDKFIYVIGAKGLTNAVRIGALGTLDCDGCGCGPEPTVWFVNAMGIPSGIFPDEEGVYTVNSGTETLYPGIYYGTIWFTNPDTPVYNSTCNTMDDEVILFGTPTIENYVNCDGGSTPQACNNAYQFVDNAPWAMTFTCPPECP